MKYGLSTLLFLIGCSSVKTWVIKQDREGGVIGYQGEGKHLQKEIKKLIPCRPYTVDHVYRKEQAVERVYKNYITSSPNTSGYADSAFQNQPSSGSAVHTGAPMMTMDREQWKEVHYHCDQSLRKTRN